MTAPLPATHLTEGDASVNELARLVLDTSRDGIVAFRSLRLADGSIRDFEFVVMNRSAGTIGRRSGA